MQVSSGTPGAARCARADCGRLLSSRRGDDLAGELVPGSLGEPRFERRRLAAPAGLRRPAQRPLDPAILARVIGEGDDDAARAHRVGEPRQHGVEIRGLVVDPDAKRLEDLRGAARMRRARPRTRSTRAASARVVLEPAARAPRARSRARADARRRGRRARAARARALPRRRARAARPRVSPRVGSMRRSSGPSSWKLMPRAGRRSARDDRPRSSSAPANGSPPRRR